MLDKALATFCLLLMFAFSAYCLINVAKENNTLRYQVEALQTKNNSLKLQIEDYERINKILPALRKRLTPLENLELNAGQMDEFSVY